MELTQAGQFEIESATLFTSTGNVINIKESIIEVNIYEDIFSNSMYGELMFGNTVGLISAGPLIGQEYLSLVISTPTLLDDKHKVKFDENIFHVIKVARGYEGNDTEIITLDLTTSELVHNQRTLVSRTLKGSYHEMVESLLVTDLNCKKDLYIEQTNEVKTIIANNEHPFDIISQFLSSSTAMRHGQPSFVFFENFKGYHFRSLQSLYAECSRFQYIQVEANSNSGDPSQPGMSGQKINQKITRDLATIIDTNLSTSKNTATNLSIGGLSSRLLSHDIVQKKYTVSQYNYLDDEEVLKQGLETLATKGKVKDFHQYNSGEIDEDGNRISDFTPIQYLCPTSTVKNKDGIYKNAQYEVYNGKGDGTEYPYDPRRHEITIQKRRSLLTNLELGVTISLQANGQTTYGAGDLVSLDVNDFGKLEKNEADKRDKFLRGDWLVEAIRHTFNSNAQKHVMYVTLRKDSVDEELEPADHIEKKPVLFGDLYSDDHFYGGIEGYDEKIGTPTPKDVKPDFPQRSATNRLGKLGRLQEF